MKVSKVAKIRNRYNQVPHLTQDTNEPRHEVTNNAVCATSKAPDQLAHTRSLIRAFAGR